MIDILCSTGAVNHTVFDHPHGQSRCFESAAKARMTPGTLSTESAREQLCLVLPSAWWVQGEKLQKETRLLTKEKECLRVELREKSSDVFTLEKNLKELQTQLTQSQWELEDTQRQQKKRLLAQSQEHEKEINLLEERMRKSSVPLPSAGSSLLHSRKRKEREQSCRETFATLSSRN